MIGMDRVKKVKSLEKGGLFLRVERLNQQNQSRK